METTPNEEVDVLDPVDGEISTNLTETENSSLNSFRYDDVDSIEELLLEQKAEFAGVFDTKRRELEKIQDDLNELMDRLNNFIADSPDEEIGCEDNDSIDAQNYDDEVSEKQDGPQEKELMKQKNWNDVPEELYVSDGLNPPEINWEVLAPFIQNVVGDLKKIRNLNQMTSSVLQRIKNITNVQNANIAEEN